MNIIRSENNPIIRPEDITPYHDGYEVIGVFNAGVAEYDDETLLLLRVAERPISDHPEKILAPSYRSTEKLMQVTEYDLKDESFLFDDPRTINYQSQPNKFSNLTSLSYILLARSKDGMEFTFDSKPFIYPFNEYNEFGIEDARCTKINESYYITYSAVSAKGIVVEVVKTTDFNNFDYEGIMLPPENKDAMIFPEKINGLYYTLHRPVTNNVGNLDVWLASSPDLVYWGNHQHLFGVREGQWDSSRIGGGVPPIKTEHGWLILYHGADDNSRYSMGAALLDLTQPGKVLSRLAEPFLEPDFPYEKEGFFGDVVFGCGAVVKDDVVTMYYGTSDTTMSVCHFSLSELTNKLLRESF